MLNSEKIAEALTRIKDITKANGCNIVRSQQMERSDRELLVGTKWLQEIIRGWYLLVKPDVASGDSTIWYANYREFLRLYLEHYYNHDYCLSAESSLDLHTSSSIIPVQEIVITMRGAGTPQTLPFNTSLYAYPSPKNIPEERTTLQGLQVMTLPYALCKASPTYFKKNPRDAAIALSLIHESAELTQILIKHNFKNAAARLIGAYEALQNQQMADSIKNELTFVGWKIHSENPFVDVVPTISHTRVKSPHAARVLSLWDNYREKVLLYFPESLRTKEDFNYLEEIYNRDAYNSLSIEGYQVNEELIARVRNNQWNPDDYTADRSERNALAARGYFEAFNAVKSSILQITNGANSGDVVEKDLKIWYQALFAPTARAGIIRQEELLGYRKGQVYIRGSRHVPFPKDALLDSMEALFTCLKNEQNGAVRAVLGHYLFVYIHPYMDGNGRLGRFLMNTMFVGSGYPWTIIQVKNRNEYLNALERAGCEQNIELLAQFIAQEMQTRGKE